MVDNCNDTKFNLSAPGIYTVTVTDVNGCKGSSTISVPAPAANFAYVPRPPCGISFDANLVLCQNSSLIDWNFGDGSHGYEPTMLHYYAQDGIYPVCVKFTCCDMVAPHVYCQSVTVNSCIPTCHAVSDFTIETDCHDASFINHSDAGGGNISYSWNFGDGSPLSSDANPHHTYTSVIPVQVCLTVTVSNPNFCISDQYCASYTPFLGVTCRQHCAYTQGFYGNGNGRTCDGSTTSRSLLTNLLSTPLVSGYDPRTVTIHPTEVNCLLQKLPGGTTPSVLPLDNYTCSTLPISLLTPQGKFQNVLLAQTITLGLNLRLSPSLNLLKLTNPYMTTYQANTCVNGTAVAGTQLVNYIPIPVLNFLGMQNTIADLLALANKALGGVYLNYISSPPPPSLGDITLALDAINSGFDKCRILAGFSNNPAPLPPPPPPRVENDLLSSEQLFKIIPNPNEGMFDLFINSESQLAASVYILNVFGQLVEKSEINITMGENRFAYDIIRYPRGIYFVRISNSEINTVLKVVMQ